MQLAVGRQDRFWGGEGSGEGERGTQGTACSRGQEGLERALRVQELQILARRLLRVPPLSLTSRSLDRQKCTATGIAMGVAVRMVGLVVDPGDAERPEVGRASVLDTCPSVTRPGFAAVAAAAAAAAVDLPLPAGPTRARARWCGSVGGRASQR